MVSGELDLASSAALEDELVRVAQSGVTQLVIDLRELEFMDSTGLSVVVAEHKRTTASGGELVLLSPQSQVLRMFEMTGLTDVLHILEDGAGERGPEEASGQAGVT